MKELIVLAFAALLLFGCTGNQTTEVQKEPAISDSEIRVIPVCEAGVLCFENLAGRMSVYPISCVPVSQLSIGVINKYCPWPVV